MEPRPTIYLGRMSPYLSVISASNGTTFRVWDFQMAPTRTGSTFVDTALDLTLLINLCKLTSPNSK